MEHEEHSHLRVMPFVPSKGQAETGEEMTIDTRVGHATTGELEKIAKEEILDALVKQDWPRYLWAIEKYNSLNNYNRYEEKFSKISKRTEQYLLEYGC